MDILKLANSETRKAIFELYFAFPEKKYYLRELERLLHLPVQNIRRDLLQLEKSGIFKREAVGNQVYYYLNNESPIFEELKKIVSKTVGMEAKLKELFSGINDIRTVFIFGSFANETADNISDVDLMIVGEVNENVLIKKISKVEDKIGREINYHIFSEKEFAKKIKEKDFFITKILSKPIIFLIGSNENIPSVS
jgi:predicted nucleotidyltransferase